MNTHGQKEAAFPVLMQDDKGRPPWSAQNKLMGVKALKEE